MVVLDAIHQIQADQANDLAVRWNCKAGKCGSCSAEINGKPRLMCMTRLSDLPLDKPVTVEPMHTFPPVKDLVTDVSWNYRVKQKITQFTPRPPDAPGRHLAHAAERTSIACRSSGSASSAFSARTSATCFVSTTKEEEFIGPRFFVYTAALEMHPLDVADRIPELKRDHGIGFCNITKCCTTSARRASRSPTTRSSRSRNAWWTSSTTRSANW